MTTSPCTSTLVLHTKSTTNHPNFIFTHSLSLFLYLSFSLLSYFFLCYSISLIYRDCFQMKFNSINLNKISVQNKIDSILIHIILEKLILARLKWFILLDLHSIHKNDSKHFEKYKKNNNNWIPFFRGQFVFFSHFRS